jgi:hypothetical protein
MRTVIRLAVAVFFISGIVGSVIGAETEKKEGPGCCQHMGVMKDAKYEITNTPDGVIIKISSDKPEVVKQIQESVAKCQAAHKSGDHKTMCPMKKEPGCPMHAEQHEGK